MICTPSIHVWPKLLIYCIKKTMIYVINHLIIEWIDWLVVSLIRKLIDKLIDKFIDSNYMIQILRKVSLIQFLWVHMLLMCSYTGLCSPFIQILGWQHQQNAIPFMVTFNLDSVIPFTFTLAWIKPGLRVWISNWSMKHEPLELWETIYFERGEIKIGGEIMKTRLKIVGASGRL